MSNSAAKRSLGILGTASRRVVGSVETSSFSSARVFVGLGMVEVPSNSKAYSICSRKIVNDCAVHGGWVGFGWQGHLGHGVVAGVKKGDTLWKHVPRRGFGTPPGADMAQKILSCEDPSDLSELRSSLEQLPPEGLSAVARAAATSDVTDRVFLDMLVAKAIAGMKALSPVDVCNILESFTELQYSHSIEFKSAVAQFLISNLESLSGDMLGHTVRSFAKLGFYDDELLENVLTYMAGKADEFSAENVADVVYAFSKCGFCHPDLVLLVDKAGALLLKEALHDRGEAIASIIDAYSRVGCTESDVLDQLVCRVTEQPDMVSVDALAKTLVAAIRLGSEDQHMINGVIASLLQRVDDLDSGLLVETIKALGGLGFRHDALLDLAIDKIVPSRIKEFSKDDLEDILSALNKLGYYSKSLVSLLNAHGTEATIHAEQK